MINKETILSNYNDRLTLLQWLKKVELALQNASAKEFRVNKLGNATLTFSIVFDDNTELTTGPIVLQQGESVAGASITNGHLLLTLTNGDVLDAGDVGAVTGFSIDGSQHLIVTYQDGTTQDLGAIFSGNVNIAGNFTADSIIENMTGYTYDKAGRSADIQYTDIYSGVVKNGNKLTLVTAMNLKLTNAVSSFRLGYFNVPASVANSLFPSVMGGISVLSLKLLTCYRTDTIAHDQTALCYAEKLGNGVAISVLFNSFDVGEEYYLRFEETFLLSGNLAS